jgi:predicted GTPase
MADVIVVNKLDTASEQEAQRAIATVTALNPAARVIRATSPISVDAPEAIRGKRVLVIEDGPTVTHGGMSFGAGWVAAKRFGAAEIVDPRPYAVGSIRETFARFPTTGMVLPAMGYGHDQVRELAETINRSPADVVIVGTPIDLGRLVAFDKPSVRVRYELEEMGTPRLEDVLRERLALRRTPELATR